jgi:hypothetical protein
VAESGRLRALARGRHWVRDDYLLGRSVQMKQSLFRLVRPNLLMAGADYRIADNSEAINGRNRECGELQYIH